MTDAGLDHGAGLGSVEPVEAGRHESAVTKIFVGSHHHAAGLGLYPDHIGRHAERHADAAALPYGVAVVAVVLTEHVALGVYDVAGSVDVGAVLLHEAGVVVVGDEAHILALGLLGGQQAEAAGMVSHLVLRHVAEGEEGARQGVGCDGKEEVGLVLRGVDGGEELRSAVFGGADACVVTRGKVGRTQRHGTGEQHLELEHAVALDARIWSRAGQVGIGEVVHYGFLEGLAQVHDIEGNAEVVGHSSCIYGIVEPTAGSRRLTGR